MSALLNIEVKYKVSINVNIIHNLISKVAITTITFAKDVDLAVCLSA